MRKLTRALCAAVLVAAFSPAALAQRALLRAEFGRKVDPVRTMQVRFLGKQGSKLKAIPVSPWVPYQPPSARTLDNPVVAVDHLEFIFGTNGEIVTDENPAYGGNCGIGRARYYFGPSYRNPYCLDDLKCGSGTEGTRSDRIGFAFNWNPPTQRSCYVAVFTTENFVIDGGGDPNDPQALQYFDGVVYDFGVLEPRADYYLADVDLSQSLQFHEMPADGSGSSVTVLENSYNPITGDLTLADHACQMMLWFTKPGNPSYLRGRNQWDDDQPTDGRWDQSEWYDYLHPGSCPALAPNEILGPTLAFLNPSTNEYTEIAPTSFRTIYGRLDSGWRGSLAEVDLDVLRHCRFVVPNATAAPIEVEVSGQTDITVPNRVKSVLLGRVLNLGGYRHAVQQYNFVLETYEDYAVANATMEFSTVVSDSMVSGHPEGKVSPSGELRSRYRLWNVNPSAVARYCYEADQFVWLLR